MAFHTGDGFAISAGWKQFVCQQCRAIIYIPEQHCPEEGDEWMALHRQTCVFLPEECRRCKKRFAYGTLNERMWCTECDHDLAEAIAEGRSSSGE